MWWVIAELLFDLSFAGILAKQLGDRGPLTIERDRRALALFVLVVIGLIVGVLTAVLLPRRVLPVIVFNGASLVAVPVVLGVILEFFRQRRSERSHLITWYGGASLGVGLAAGRLLVLWWA